LAEGSSILVSENVALEERKKKQTQMNGTFNDRIISDENKQPLFKNCKKTIHSLIDRRLMGSCTCL
jgi:hypothetical protein